MGGAALDLVAENALGADAQKHAETILTLSVLVILLTAPLGAIGIAIAGPAWLSKDGPPGAEPAPAPEPSRAATTTEVVVQQPPAEGEPGAARAVQNGDQKT